MVRRMMLTGTRKSYDLIRSKYMSQRPRDRDDCEETLTLAYPWARRHKNRTVKFHTTQI